MSMSMTMSPSGSPTAMSMMTKCSFCHGLVIPVPDFELIQGQTCGSVKAGVAKLDATNPNCAMAKAAEEYCCLPVVETTTTVAATDAAPTPPAPTPPTPTQDEPAFTPTPPTPDAPSG